MCFLLYKNILNFAKPANQNQAIKNQLLVLSFETFSRSAFVERDCQNIELSRIVNRIF